MRRTKSCILTISATVMAGIVLFAILLFIVRSEYRKGMNNPLDPNDVPRVFIIVSGWSFDRTAIELEKQSFISDSRFLKLHVRLNPDAAAIKSGEYLISAAMSPLDILQRMLSGQVITYSVTFPEGLTLSEMATRWDNSGFGSAGAFKHAAHSYRHPSLPFPSTGWEGYLFPETYCFTKGFDELKLVERMIDQLQETLRPEWLASAREHGLTLHEAVTLASLIEKETRLPEERELVSAVFHNRLKRGILLQCDPTVIYALGETYPGRLLKKHLEMDIPYNTYVRAGLPPGPICSPGKESLEAACFPAEESFLYFVADSSGGHTFSRTLREHNQAVQRYRQRIKKPSQ
ncbi:endolytic transglycosylase MltG [bacterium]|nr:endolytic transglycosylase MltG [candidate division CSSED10-310 bacterium]